MADTMKALQTVTVGAGGTSSISFTNIPQTYTDFVVVLSARAASGGAVSAYIATINGAGYTGNLRYLNTDGGTVYTGTNIPYAVGGSSYTSNTFTSTQFYISNYTSNAFKSISIESAAENNATGTAMFMTAFVAQVSSGINAISFSCDNTFVQYSTATLYGVFNQDVNAVPSAPTIGTATAGLQSASITFTGVSGAASYTMTSSPGSITATGTTSPITVTGLTGGTAYTFTCVANNPFGSSGASAASNSVTPTSPATWGSWTLTTLSSTKNFPSTMYSNNLWVAPQFFVPGSPPGNYGEAFVWTSPDALSWTQRNLPTDRQWRPVGYIGGLHVIVTDGVNYVTSPDAITWTARTYAGGNGQAMPQATNGSLAAFPTYGGPVYTTTDGLNFTSRTNPSGVAARMLWLSHLSLWMILDDNTNNYYTSPDTITWTTRTLAVSGNFKGGGYNGSTILLYAVGTTTAYTSIDAVNWTSRTLPASYGEPSIFSPTGGQFVLVTNGGVTAHTSPDGITWTARNMPSDGANASRQVSAPTGTYVIGAANGKMARITTS
jgi:hypothetical protein